MPTNKQFTQTNKTPFDQITLLSRRVAELESLFNSDRFSQKNRYIKEIAIAKDGKFRIEQKDALPTFQGTSTQVGALGELVVVGGVLYLCSATDEWTTVSNNTRVRAVAAGTAADSPTVADGLVQVSTSGAQALTITLPEAADSLGTTLVFTFVTDGGQNVTINRTGSDTIDETADLGNTAITMEDAKDTIIIQAVQDNVWAVIKNIGCTLT
jgi:hypothetical protein